MPIPMTRQSLLNMMGAERLVCVTCGTKSAERLSALQGVSDQVQLECIDCLVKAAETAAVPLDAVTAFIDDRYMGSMEACWKLQRLGPTYESFPGSPVQWK